MDNKKISSGLLKILIGAILLIAGGIFSIRGCQDVSDGLLDESNTPILDESGNEIEI